MQVADLLHGMQRRHSSLQRRVVGKANILGGMNHDPPGNVARVSKLAGYMMPLAE